MDFITSFVGILGATLIPAYIALYFFPSLKFIPTRYLAATGAGLSFWYFFDTMGDAGQLDVNSGFSGGAAQVGLVIAFIAGVTTLAIFDNFAVPKSTSDSVKNQKLLFLIPVAVAAVMGIHSLGEGWNFGSVVSATSSQSLADAFGGGLSALASYPMHKLLEAIIIAAAYTAYVGRSGITSAQARWQLPALGLLFGLPSVIGTSMGYIANLDTTYFFAFGASSALYTALRLVEASSPRFRVGENVPSYLGWKVFLAMLTGFLLLYGVALFH